MTHHRRIAYKLSWVTFLLCSVFVVDTTNAIMNRNCLRIVRSSFLKRSFTFKRRPYFSGSNDHNCIAMYRQVPFHSTTGLSMAFGRDKNDNDVSKFNQDGPGAAYIPLDDVMMYDQPITCDPDFPCLIDDDDDVSVAKKYALDFQQSLLIVIPMVTPFVAFFTFDWFAEAYSAFTDLLSRNNKWVAVDGGSYQAQIIAPAINGLVVPAVALLFATLISTTITTLRLRQVEIRRAINMEAGELRAMECLVDAIDPGFVQDQCRSYVCFCFLLVFSLFFFNNIPSRSALHFLLPNS